MANQDPNMLTPGGVPGQKGIYQKGATDAFDNLLIKRSFEKIEQALQQGLDVGPMMQDLALIKSRNAEIFKRGIKDYQGSAEHFVKNLGNISMAMNSAARMSERARVDLLTRTADYTRGLREMGMAAGAAATQGKAALLTGFGSAMNAYIKRVREIETLNLSAGQKDLAMEHARIDRDKAMAGNKRFAEMAMSGSVTSQNTFKSAIGTAMKDAAKEASGVSGGIRDLMGKGGSFASAIADKVKAKPEGLLARMAANDTIPDGGKNATLGVLSKTLGSMPAMFQQLIGYAGQFTSVAMSWALIVKVLTEVVGALDFYRKMQATAVSMSTTDNKGLTKSYNEVAQAITDKTNRTRLDLVWTGKAREIEAEAAQAVSRASLVNSKGAEAVGDLTNAWMQAAIVGAEFGRTVSESMTIAERVTKAFGSNNVPEHMRVILTAAQAANMSFEDMNSTLGDVTEQSMKFGASNTMALRVGSALAVRDIELGAHRLALMKTYRSLLDAPLTYKAGLVMGAHMDRPDQALGELFKPGSGKSMLNIMGQSISGYMNILDRDMKESGIGPNMSKLAKGQAYAALYQNPAIAETYAFLNDTERGKFDKALTAGKTKDIEAFINNAGMATNEMRGLTAMEKQVSLLEKVVTVLNSGFQWVLDAIPKTPFSRGSGTDFANQVNVNNGGILAGLTARKV